MTMSTRTRDIVTLTLNYIFNRFPRSFRFRWLTVDRIGRTVLLSYSYRCASVPFVQEYFSGIKVSHLVTAVNPGIQPNASTFLDKPHRVFFCVLFDFHE